jgi:hypothetical protein
VRLLTNHAESTSYMSVYKSDVAAALSLQLMPRNKIKPSHDKDFEDEGR